MITIRKLTFANYFTGLIVGLVAESWPAHQWGWLGVVIVGPILCWWYEREYIKMIQGDR